MAGPTNTVIGSFWKQPTPPEESIRRVVDLQLRYGIQPLSDGEQRADMIGYFDQLPGLKGMGLRTGLMGQIRPMDDPRKFIKIQDYKLVRDYLHSIRRDDVQVKTTITGPITLGFMCAANELAYYRDLRDRRIFDDASVALRPLIVELLRLGSYVQVDEPCISLGVLRPAEVLEVINSLLGGIVDKDKFADMLSLHVCGDLTRIKGLFDSLLRLDMKVLSLAFAGKDEAGNFGLLDREKIEAHDKIFGAGVVPVATMTVEAVEPVEKVGERTRALVKAVGLENLCFFHPDCGLGQTPLPVAEKILQTQVAATSSFINKFPEAIK